MKDLDFRVGDKIYHRILNKLGEINTINDERIFASFEDGTEGAYSLDGCFYGSYDKDGVYHPGQVIFHDPDRKIMKSISDHLLDISKPPKRKIKMYFNIEANYTWSRYHSKTEALKHYDQNKFGTDFLAIAQEIEIDEKGN